MMSQQKQAASGEVFNVHDIAKARKGIVPGKKLFLKSIAAAKAAFLYSHLVDIATADR
jgi:hypothetical protein